jgi:hypothetical protein
MPSHFPDTGAKRYTLTVELDVPADLSSWHAEDELHGIVRSMINDRLLQFCNEERISLCNADVPAHLLGAYDQSDIDIGENETMRRLDVVDELTDSIVEETGASVERIWQTLQRCNNTMLGIIARTSSHL